MYHLIGYMIVVTLMMFVTWFVPESIQVSWSRSVIVPGNSKSSGRIAVTPEQTMRLLVACQQPNLVHL